MKLFKNALHKELFMFSMPLLLSMLTQQLYSAVDSMIVGMNLGIHELNAVGNGATIATSFFIVSGAFEMSCDVIISRFYGQKDYKNIAKWIKNITFYTLTGVGFFSLIGVFFIEPIMNMLSIPLDIRHLVKLYSVIYIAGMPLIGLYDVVRATLISLDESKTSFYYILASSLFNIVLDIIFIRYFSMGVAGAAIATVLSQAILLIISLTHLLKKIKTYDNEKYKLSICKEDIKYLLSIALPTAFQQCGVTAMYLFLQAFINPFGNQIASGYVAMSRVMSIARQCLVAFSMTASIYSARYLASKDYDNLKDSLFFILKITTFYDIIIGVIFIFFNKPICSLFFDIGVNNEAFVFFKTYLICSVFMMFTSGYKFIFEGVLRSALRMKQFMFSTGFDMGSRIVVTYLLLSIVNEHAFWMGETIARTSGCIFSFIFLAQYFKQNNILKKHS